MAEEATEVKKETKEWNSEIKSLVIR